MNPKRESIEKIYAIISLCFYSQAFSYFVAVDNPTYLGIQILAIANLFITLFLLLRNWERALAVVLNSGKLILIFSIAIFLSITWSDLPFAETLYRSGGFNGYGVLPFIQVTLFGIYLATRYSLNDQLKLLGWMYIFVILMSFFVALAMPTYGIMGSHATIQDMLHAGSWRGVYIHKNGLGIQMVLASFVLHLLSKKNRRGWVFGIFFILSIVLIILSTSKTALITMLSLNLLIPFFRALRWKSGIAIPFFIIAILVTASTSIILVANLESILSALGRDLTLTGRTGAWVAILEKVKEQFWFGYGYSSFWPNVANDQIVLWSGNSRIKFTHAHNGFLDLALDLGFLGCSIFIASLLATTVKAIEWLKITKTFHEVWPLIFILFIVLINLSESSLIQEKLPWILYVSVAISLPIDIKRKNMSREMIMNKFGTIHSQSVS